MTVPDLVERLAEHRTLSSVPREQLEWVAAHGTFKHLEAGTVLFPTTNPVPGLYFVLSGHLSIKVDRGAGPRKVMEWGAGDVTGLLPYSRMGAPPGNVVAEEPTDVVLVPRNDLPRLTRECYELTAVLVHIMLDRARHFTSTDLHDEKLLSLGRLAAGLAHELNNPASAVIRSAESLLDRLAGAETASRNMGATDLTREQMEVIERVRDRCLTTVEKSVRSAMEQADHEDALEDWLRAHDADESAASILAESAATLEGLDELASVVEGPVLEAVLRWLASACEIRRLAADIRTAASRIEKLVAAVKSFTYMDKAASAIPVDVGQGLTDTLIMLKAKAKAKSASIEVEVDAGLPLVCGFGGELNQVWVNLIDNALDAVLPSGHVAVRAARCEGGVVVSIQDDGPGIPAEFLERIFDPFFTTKAVGQGTGLGLDIVRRLVRRHDGEIEVRSEPGRTEFRVTLPAAPSGATSRGKS